MGLANGKWSIIPINSGKKKIRINEKILRRWLIRLAILKSKYQLFITAIIYRSWIKAIWYLIQLLGKRLKIKLNITKLIFRSRVEKIKKGRV